VIGGVRLLSDFSAELVTVRVKGGEVSVVGRGLKIARFDENEIEVLGMIDDVKTNVVARK